MVRNTKTHSSTGITLLTHWHAYMLAIQLANKCVTFAQYIASLSLPLRGMAWQALRLKNVLLCQRVDISKRRCISYGPPECRYACAEYKYLVRVYGATNAWPLRTIYHDTQWKGWRSCPYIPYIHTNLYECKDVYMRAHLSYAYALRKDMRTTFGSHAIVRCASAV